jgi:hypothetical protein
VARFGRHKQFRLFPIHENPQKTFCTDAKCQRSKESKNKSISTACYLRSRDFMELRKHPKMRWHGRPNWPPEWNGPFGPDRPLPKGEVGTLVRAECRLGDLRTPHCYLDIQWNGQDYFGSLYFDDPSFIEKVCDIWLRQVERPLSEIGSLDI